MINTTVPKIAAQLNPWVRGSPSKVPMQTHSLPALALSLGSSLPRILTGLPAAPSARRYGECALLATARPSCRAPG